MDNNIVAYEVSHRYDARDCYIFNVCSKCNYEFAPNELEDKVPLIQYQYYKYDDLVTPITVNISKCPKCKKHVLYKTYKKL